jgi:hypothetical protein
MGDLDKNAPIMMNLRWTTDKGMSASLTVTAEDAVQLHDRLAAAMAAVIKPAGEPAPNGAGHTNDEHQCPEHHVAFEPRSNDRGIWYSHVKDDGNWCREKNGGK